MEKIKLGIIGCGGDIARLHINNIIAGKCPSVTVTALSTRKIEKAEAISQRLKAEMGMDAKVFATDMELIQNADVDAVLISTPHYQHEELSIAAMENDIHVLCEKPSGAYALQALRMNEVADKTGKLFGMMFHHRTNPMFIKARQMVQSGELGEIRRINFISTNSYRGQNHYDAVDWRGTWEKDGGGVVMNQAPHQLDLIRWIFGMPKKVTGFLGLGRWHDIQTDDDVTAYMEYENGATAIFIGSTSDAPGTMRLEITAEFGKVVCEDNKLKFWKLEGSLNEYSKTEPTGSLMPKFEVIDVPLDGVGVYTAHGGVVEQFARAIIDGSEQIADGRDGYESLSIANALILSQWNNNRAITLPIDDEEYFKTLKEHY
ncbi:MAG: Gfo/Idh/MocA family oxidoreductase [Bacillota bacterium]